MKIVHKILCFFGFHTPISCLPKPEWHPIGVFGMPPYQRSYFCEHCKNYITKEVNELPIEYFGE